MFKTSLNKKNYNSLSHKKSSLFNCFFFPTSEALKKRFKFWILDLKVCLTKLGIGAGLYGKSVLYLVCSNCAVVSRIQIISKTQSLPACILSHYTLGAKTIGNREKFWQKALFCPWALAITYSAKNYLHIWWIINSESYPKG